MTAKKIAAFTLAALTIHASLGHAEDAKTNALERAAGAALKVIVDQDMEKLPLGAPVWNTGLINNTWTGDPCEIKIIDTGTEFGKALDIDVNNFSQISLGGPYKVEKGVKLRVSGSLMSQPPMEYALDLSRGPMCFMVNGKAMEQWKRFNFIVETGAACPDAFVHLRTFGMGKMWLGDLKIEECTESVEEMKPPRLGNMLQNSSFELGMDGVWYRPAAGGSARVDDTQAASGRRSLCMEGGGIYSSAYYPVAYKQPYILSFSAKADYDKAAPYVEFAGPTPHAGCHNIPKGQWKRITVCHEIDVSKGSVFENPAVSVRIGADVPKGAHLWIDDVDLRCGTNAVYAPAYATEYALSIDKPHGRVDQNAPFTLKMRGTKSCAPGEAAPPALPLRIRMLDEKDVIVKSWDVVLGREPNDRSSSPPAFANYTGELRIEGLPCGFWRFVTAPADQRTFLAKIHDRIAPPKDGISARDAFAANEGEALVSVTPLLPAETPETWPAGTHAGPVPIDASYGTRLARLHDATIATRWWVVEPEQGKWNWEQPDATIESYRKAGFRVLGVLDGVAPWRTGTGKMAWTALEYPDRDFTAWRNYVKAIVTRYKGKVDAWEICNEPNVWGKSFDGEKNTTWYVELLKQAYQAAKEADPHVIVVGGGGASQVEKNNVHWKEMIDAGLFSDCDVVSYHGYGRAGSALIENQALLFDFMDWINGEMKARIGKTLPVWDTELGFGPRTSSWKFWQPNREGFNPVEAARTIAISRACEQFTGVVKSFYYHGWHYLLTEPASLVNFHDANLQLTPLTVTLPVVIRELYGLLPSAKERQGTANILCFKSPDKTPKPRTVWMIWTLKAKQAVVIGVPEASRVSAVNLFGRPVKVAARDGKVAVAAGPWPIYLSAVEKE